MNDDWFILIYQSNHAEARDRLAEGLRALGSLTVQTEHNRGEWFVVIECPGTIPALAIHELVMSIDAGAELVDTHCGMLDLVIAPLSRQTT